jgi:transposase
MKSQETCCDNVITVDFSGKHLFVGMDLHKKQWVVTVRTVDLELRTFSMDPFPAALDRHLHREYRGGIFHLVYEAGCFGYATYDYFREKGIDIIVTPPNRLYRERGAIKTDKRDSRQLAMFLSKGMIPAVVVPSKQVRELRQIIRIRDKQKKRKTQIQREIRGMLVFLNYPLGTRSWSKAMLSELKELTFSEEGLTLAFSSLIEEYEFYKEKVIESERLIKKISEQIPVYRNCLQRLIRIRGIGNLTGFRLVVQLFDRKDRFVTAEKLVHYLGLTPSERSSGDKQRKGRCGHRGNPELRAMIIQMAWQAVRWDPVLLDKFERVYHRSGSTQKAIVAVARKLMVRLYTIMQRDETYQIGIAA